MGVWGQVARGSSSTGDKAESASGESLTAAERTYLSFSSKIALIKDILGDKVPVSVDSTELPVTSLLSIQGPEEGPTSAHLPLAAVVRSALSATSSAIATATREAPWSAKSDADGLPLVLKALRGSARYYKVSSPDFLVSASTVSREMASEQRSTSVILPQRTTKSMEEHIRLSLGCASVSEWLLAAVYSILHGCQESVSSAVSLDDLRESVSTSLNSSLDLRSSAGIAIQDGTLATASVLGELTLARRDACIRSLGTASSSFKERLRNAPIVSPHEPMELPKPGTATDLFGGLTSGLLEDRWIESKISVDQNIFFPENIPGVLKHILTRR